MIQLLQYSHNLEYRYLLDNQLMMMFEYLNYFENLSNEMIKEKKNGKKFLPDDDDDDDEPVRQLRLRLEIIGISSSINVDEHCLRRNSIGSKW